jgi:hypothetical protein
LVFVRESSVVGNLLGLAQYTNGKIISLGGNLVSGNTTDGSFFSTVPPS